MNATAINHGRVRLRRALTNSLVFVIRNQAGHAIHFVKNVCGRHYSIAPDDDATIFPDRASATAMVAHYLMNPAHYTVHEFPL
jgi:hypothetical protein